MEIDTVEDGTECADVALHSCDLLVLLCSFYILGFELFLQLCDLVFARLQLGSESDNRFFSNRALKSISPTSIGASTAGSGGVAFVDFVELILALQRAQLSVYFTKPGEEYGAAKRGEPSVHLAERMLEHAHV